MALSMGPFIARSGGSREIAETLSIRQVRFFVALGVLFVILALGRALLPEVRQAKMVRLHILRNVVHFTAQYFWTIGIVMLPLASVFALEFTMPLWVAFFAWLFLKEQLTGPRILATICVFIVVLITVSDRTSFVRGKC